MNQNYNSHSQVDATLSNPNLNPNLDTTVNPNHVLKSRLQLVLSSFEATSDEFEKIKLMRKAHWLMDIIEQNTVSKDIYGGVI